MSYRYWIFDSDIMKLEIKELDPAKKDQLLD